MVEQDVLEALERFRREGVTSIAVAFMHAYANPTHELEAERILRAAGFDGDLSLSHRISGEYREYERTCTTVIDAYVRGRMNRYLLRLEERLHGLGFSGDALVRDRPFETVMSGPVAGAEGAGALARRLGLDGVITADVGGTSFDTCLVLDGRPQITFEGRIVGLPVQSAWVDVRSIGAGGGSIAHVDVGGLLRVGPRSAGADPGPASYGRGGEEPTVTDAALALGMLGEGRFASGDRLDIARAEAALRPLGDRLRMGVDEVARGVMTIAGASMADAIREITVEQGVDPREMHLLAFGGAGPMMATLLADELEIGRIVIPPYAGNFSALGLLSSDLTQSASRTRITRLTEAGLDEINALLAELFDELAARRKHQHRGSGESREVRLDMRYVGQEYTLTVTIDSEGGRIALPPESVRDAFVADYTRTFSSTMADAVEIVAARATLRTHLPELEPQHHPDASADGDAPTRPAYSFRRGEVLPFRLLERERLAVGLRIDGPAILSEATATTYLDAGYRAEVHPSGALFIEAIGGDA
jgi:N-methylhydantoinase A